MIPAVFPVIIKIFVFPAKVISHIKSVYAVAKMAVGAGAIALNVGRLCTLSKEKMKELAIDIVNQVDAANTIASDDSSHMKRLNDLVKNESSVEGIALNYKVYITNELNALSFPDGSIRINSGLMDILDDNELLFIIGHEIGHIIKNHSLKAMRMALINHTIGQSLTMIKYYHIDVLASLFMNIGNEFINAKYSQRNEIVADKYGYMFLKRKGDNIDAALSALRKLPEIDEDNISAQFLTHPKLQKRIEKIESMIKNEIK